MSRSVILTVLCAICLSAPAKANIFDLYGFNPRGIGMGGAMSSLADDYTATYYNPASMTQSDKVRFGAGFMLTVPVLHVERSLPVCVASTALCEAALGTSYSSREAVLPQTFAGFTLGWVFPLGGIFENKVALGFAIYLPSLNIIRAEALDPQTPHFYLYQNLPDQTVILSSIAYRPLDWLSVGAGVQVLANVFGEASFDIHALQGTFEKRSFDLSLIPKAAATAGLWFRPLDGFQLGLTYRQSLDLTFQLPADIGLGDSFGLGLDLGGRVLYSPHQFGLGVSYHWLEPDVTVSAQVDYAMWSLAPDPSPRIGVDISGTLPDGLGLGDALDVTTQQSPVVLNLRDTWTPRFGVEWGPLDWLELRAGYFFRPSPVPVASGLNNYLDNSVHGFSAGTTFEIVDPFQVNPNPIRVSLAGQLGWLPFRRVAKDDAYDPIGDMDHGGVTYSMSFSITQTY